MKLSGMKVEGSKAAAGTREQEKGEWIQRPAALESSSSFALGWRSKEGADFEKVSGKCNPKCVCNTDNYCLCVSKGGCPHRCHGDK